MQVGPLSFPRARDFGSSYHSSLRDELYRVDVVHPYFVLVREGVFGERVVGDVGGPLQGPFLRLDDSRCDVGDLGDVAPR